METMFHIMRGSTPVLRFSMPIGTDANAVIYATFSQDDAPVLEYRRGGEAGSVAAGGELTLGSGGELRISMTQADTLQLRAGSVLVQFRIRTAVGADVSLPCRGVVGDVRKGGVI